MPVAPLQRRLPLFRLRFRCVRFSGDIASDACASWACAPFLTPSQALSDALSARDAKGDNEPLLKMLRARRVRTNSRTHARTRAPPPTHTHTHWLSSRPFVWCWHALCM
eukprot:6211382-Pleurochrysis_carterae.AAC.5